jgi:uncharacterized cupin superfamily protein
VVPEAPLKQTEHGLVAASEGWFVVNAREGRWRHRAGWGNSIGFQGETDFPQVGIGIVVLQPGEPNAMYHQEIDEENFLVLRATRCSSPKARSGRCAAGISFTVRRGRST